MNKPYFGRAENLLPVIVTIFLFFLVIIWCVQFSRRGASLQSSIGDQKRIADSKHSLEIPTKTSNADDEQNGLIDFNVSINKGHFDTIMAKGNKAMPRITMHCKQCTLTNVLTHLENNYGILYYIDPGVETSKHNIILNVTNAPLSKVMQQLKRFRHFRWAYDNKDRQLVIKAISKRMIQTKI